jgi:beta-glucosidase
MRLVVEPGVFDVMIGASSQDIRLSGTLEILKEKVLTRYRRFASKAVVK